MVIVFYRGLDLILYESSRLKALCSTKMMMHGDTHFGWSERHHKEREICSPRIT